MSTITVQLAQFRLAALQTLTASTKNADSALSGTSDSTAANGSSEALGALTDGDLDGAKKLAAAFENRQSIYSKQISELGKFKADAAQVGDAAKKLQSLTADSSAEEIKDALTSFATAFNAFDAKFDPAFAKGGTFDDLQATRITKFSLEREVGNVLVGAGTALGFGGLANAGFSIGDDGQITVDEAKLDKFISTDKASLVGGIKDMSENYVRTTNMLLEPDKFIGNREARLADALDFIASHIAEVQQQASASGTTASFTS